MPTNGDTGQTAHAGSFAILFPACLVMLLPALGLCACSRMSSLPFKCYLLIYEKEVHPCILVYESTCQNLTSFSLPLPSGNSVVAFLCPALHPYPHGMTSHGLLVSDCDLSTGQRGRDCMLFLFHPQCIAHTTAHTI